MEVTLTVEKIGLVYRGGWGKTIKKKARPIVKATNTRWLVAIKMQDQDRYSLQIKIN